jgi:hypothetical protein
MSEVLKLETAPRRGGANGGARCHSKASGGDTLARECGEERRGEERRGVDLLIILMTTNH